MAQVVSIRRGPGVNLGLAHVRREGADSRMGALPTLVMVHHCIC
jgi:hypothetical protein